LEQSLVFVNKEEEEEEEEVASIYILYHQYTSNQEE